MTFEPSDIVSYVGNTISRQCAQMIGMGHWSPIDFHSGKYCVVISSKTVSFVAGDKGSQQINLIDVRAVGNQFDSLVHAFYQFYEFEIEKV